jgi:hypothetical protein
MTQVTLRGPEIVPARGASHEAQVILRKLTQIRLHLTVLVCHCHLIVQDAITYSDDEDCTQLAKTGVSVPTSIRDARAPQDNVIPRNQKRTGKPPPLVHSVIDPSEGACHLVTCPKPLREAFHLVL